MTQARSGAAGSAVGQLIRSSNRPRSGRGRHEHEPASIHADRPSWPLVCGQAARARGTRSPSSFIRSARASMSPRSLGRPLRHFPILAARSSPSATAARPARTAPRSLAFIHATSCHRSASLALAYAAARWVFPAPRIPVTACTATARGFDSGTFSVASRPALGWKPSGSSGISPTTTGDLSPTPEGNAASGPLATGSAVLRRSRSNGIRPNTIAAAAPATPATEPTTPTRTRPHSDNRRVLYRLHHDPWVHQACHPVAIPRLGMGVTRATGGKANGDRRRIAEEVGGSSCDVCPGKEKWTKPRGLACPFSSVPTWTRDAEHPLAKNAPPSAWIRRSARCRSRCCCRPRGSAIQYFIRAAGSEGPAVPGTSSGRCGATRAERRNRRSCRSGSRKG